MRKGKRPKTHRMKSRRKRLKSRSQRLAVRLKRQLATYSKRYFGIVVILVILGAVIFTSVKTVIDIKRKSSLSNEQTFTIQQSDEDVLGLSGIPVFPGAAFMFANNIELDVVQEFLADGKSAYLLPMDAEWDNAKDFYMRELEKQDWAHELSVDLSDDTMLYGEYWTKDSVGLRIYTKLNDIWYEKITADEAKSGLSNIVSRENELQMMLAMNVGDELPEEFPWSLSYSSDWSVEIKKSNLLEIELAEFTNAETGGTLSVVPVDFLSLEPLQQICGRYVDEVNSHRDAPDKFDVESSGAVSVAGQEAVRFDLKSESGVGALCVVPHPESGVIYAIGTYSGEVAFFNHVIDNLEVSGAED
ncbi:MAG: hypothetical protein U9Q67_00310 [Patescibacteria group bacterium]|nr:hypothetical protein [Patescibacteria group bacterium]